MTLNFIEIFAKIYGKIEEILEIWISRGFGGGDPKASENIKKLVEKSTDTFKMLKIFTNSLANFDLTNGNFNNNSGNFDGILKIFNNSKRNLKSKLQTFARLGEKPFTVENFEENFKICIQKSQ